MKRYFKEGVWVYCSVTGEYGWVDLYTNSGNYNVAIQQDNFKVKSFSIYNLKEMKLNIDESILNKMYIEMALLSGDKEWFNQLIRKGDSSEETKVIQ